MDVTDALRGDPGTYPEVDNLTLRTDQSFRECQQPEHHHEEKISSFSVPPNRHGQIVPHRLYASKLSWGHEKDAVLLWTGGRSEYQMSSGDVARLSERLVNTEEINS